MQKSFKRIHLVCLSLSLFLYSCASEQLNTGVTNNVNATTSSSPTSQSSSSIVTSTSSSPVASVSPSVATPSLTPLPAHEVTPVASPTAKPIPSISPVATSSPTPVSTALPSHSSSSSSSGSSSSSSFFPSNNNQSNDPFVALKSDDLRNSFSVAGLNEKEALGKRLFFDVNLSSTKTQSCATCHDPQHAFTTASDKMIGGITLGVNVVNGVTFGGKRNTPTAMYLATDPDFAFSGDGADADYSGGSFYDGRAKNLEAQALIPILSNTEMNMASKDAVMTRVKSTLYANKFKTIFGNNVFDNTETAYAKIGEVIGAYERSKELNPFTSKYDYFKKGMVTLTPAEARGFELYKAENKANCAACHVLETDNSHPAIFTDFSYDNLGLPQNSASPFFTMPAIVNPDGASFLDKGLGDGDNGLVTDAADQHGRFKVPTLRNIANTAPYMHNGVFTNLKDVVRFYNSSCAPGNPDGWGPPEFPVGQNCDEIGNQGLTDDEMNDVVTFLGTLSDGYHP